MKPKTSYIDSFSGAPLPVLVVRGWAPDPVYVDVKLQCADGSVHAPTVFSREQRLDVVSVMNFNFSFPGFVAEFHLTAKPKAVLLFGESYEVPDADAYSQVEPHYSTLLETDRPLTRDEVYLPAPPVPPNDLIIEITSTLLGTSILDFGCGTGELVAKLRALGRGAAGLEVDTPAAREQMSEDAAPFVTLYDGNLPAPYADAAFESVCASEVLEHVADPAAVAGELMRIAGKSIFVTARDMSSIPLSWPTGTVPWWLLESRQVNFFTPKSLTRLFTPTFRAARSFRFYNKVVNDRLIPGYIGILFRRA